MIARSLLKHYTEFYSEKLAKTSRQQVISQVEDISTRTRLMEYVFQKLSITPQLSDEVSWKKKKNQSFKQIRREAEKQTKAEVN